MSSRPLQWLDRLAHDLRGPLTPLQTAAYLLRSGKLDAPKQAELLELMERQTRRLGRMIDEVGDWSRASQERLVSVNEVVETELLVDMACSALPAVDGVSVSGEFAGDAGQCKVRCDMQRLVQLLRSVIEFAIARSGQVPRVTGARADHSVLIEVSDSGPALDEVSRAGLLTEPLPEPPDEGLGLRLLIASAIAEAHAGRLQVENAEAGGLRWRLELPVEQPPAVST
ncbi:MAG TPA: HAMP domain-containing sensor histidine kinase [Xanthomonadaceae bacterium]|nr:HAMP domain-containing sensor histidine kinase [Xanthomonadaceae bacterium]